METNHDNLKMNDRDDTPTEINRAAEILVDNLLSYKSRIIYKQCYDNLVEWQQQHQTTSVSQETMLVYFDEISKKFKPPSIWAKYSMLKSTLQNFRNIGINKYNRLLTFLKNNSKGFKSTKSKTLQPEDVEKFLTQAPDDQYLAIKIALILGITGACRRGELKNITVNDIEHHKKMIVVKIPFTNTDIARKFTVEGEFYEIFKKYEALRPKKTDSDNFFLCLRNRRCTQQVIGVNTFGAIPKTIATYLKLKDPERYTGHSFRRTSATMLADGGADLMTLKRHGGWKSDQVAMGYIEDSINKKKICRKICSSIDLNRQRATYKKAKSTPPEESIPKDIIFDDIPFVSSMTPKNDKENSSNSSALIIDKKIAIELKNCNITFNFTKA